MKIYPKWGEGDQDDFCYGASPKKNYFEIALTLGFVMYLKCKKNLRRLTKVNKFILGYGEMIEKKRK